MNKPRYAFIFVRPTLRDLAKSQAALEGKSLAKWTEEVITKEVEKKGLVRRNDGNNFW